MKQLIVVILVLLLGGCEIAVNPYKQQYQIRPDYHGGGPELDHGTFKGPEKPRKPVMIADIVL